MSTLWRYSLLAIFIASLLPVLAAESPLTMQVLPASTEAKRFTFGERALVRFVLKNTSDRVVVVTRIESKLNPNEEPVSLVGNVAGEVTRDTSRDVYSYQQLQWSSRIPFYAGLLLPGQDFSFAAPYRPLIAEDEFVVSYYASNQEYRHSLESMAPFTVYSRDGGNGLVMLFLPFNENKWLEHKDKWLFDTYSLLEQRGVIISAGIAGNKPQVVTIKQTFKFADPQSSVTPENLRKIVARITKEDPPAIIMAAYSRALGGFCLQERDNRWVLSTADQRDRGDPFPEWNFAFLNDIDLKGRVLIKVGKKQPGGGSEHHDAGWKLWDTYPVFYGDIMSPQGEFIELTAAQLRPFLLRMREAGGILDTQPYSINSRYYWMKILE